MNQKTLLSLSVALLGIASVARADLTNAAYWSLNYNNLNCSVTWDGPSSSLTTHATQYGSAGMQGTFYADSALDPKATKIYNISNDTGSNWFGYDIKVYMDRSFSLSNIVATLPANWFVYNSPTVVNNSGSAVYFPGSEYTAEIILSAGTPIPDGGELDFKYDMGFSGALAYRFADELSPIFTPVPEPCALGIAGIGGLLLVRRASRRRCIK